LANADHIPTPLRQRWTDFRTGPLAGLLWGVGAVFCAWMMSWSPNSLGLVGIAHVDEVQVTAPLDGEIAEVLVDLYDEVRPGDVIALMDTTEVEARLATAAAEVDRLRAELEAASARLADELDRAEHDREAELRRFRNDEEELGLEVLSLYVELERDRLERDRLRAQLDRVDQLTREGLHPELERDDLANRVRVLDGAIGRGEALIAATEAAHGEATARRAAFEVARVEVPLKEPYLSPLREAIEVQRLRLGEIGVLRERLLLRAPIPGRIRTLLVGPGQSIVQGDPIAMVSDPTVTRVVAYVPEVSAGEIGLGARLLVARMADPRTVAESYVTEIGPTVELLPERLWRDPVVPEYGLPLLARAPLALVPGERVRVRFTGDGRATSSVEVLAAAD
jgi:HlyD family secretion protein